MSREQIYWLNWSNIRNLLYNLEDLQNMGRPNIFSGHSNLYDSFSSGNFRLKDALKLVQNPNFALSLSENQGLNVEIHLAKDSFDDVLLFFRLMPENTSLTISEKQFKLIPTVLEKLPHEKVKFLILKSDRRSRILLKGEKNLLEASRLAKTISDFKALREALEKLEPPRKMINSVQTNEVPVSLNDTDTVQEARAVIFYYPKADTPKKTVYIGPTNETLTFQIPVEAFTFEVEGLQNVKDIWLNPLNITDLLNHASAEIAAKNCARLIVKAASTLRRLDFCYPRLNEITEDKNMALNVFYETLIKELSEFEFPSLRILELNEVSLRDIDFFHLLEKCPQLDILRIRNITTDGSLDQFTTEIKLPTRTLDTVYSELKGEFVLKLIKMMPMLQILVAPHFNLFEEQLVPLPYLDTAYFNTDFLDETEVFWKAYPSLYHLMTKGAFPVSNNEPDDLRLTVVRPETPPKASALCWNTGATPKSFTVMPVFRKIEYYLHRETLSEVTFSEGRIRDQNLSFNFQPYTPVTIDPEGLLQGEAVLILERNTFTPLAGLSSSDVLCNPESPDVSLDHLEFGYDPELRMYGVRFKESGPEAKRITLRYQMSYPIRFLIPNEHNIIPQGQTGIEFTAEGVKIDGSKWTSDPLVNLNALIHYFRNIKPGDPGFTKGQSELDRLNLIMNSQMGVACEGRSQLFCLIMKTFISDCKVYMVKNGSHAYVQLVVDDKAFDIDLGGYPTEVEIKKPEPTVDTPKAAPVAKAKSEKGALVTTHDASKGGYLKYALEVIQMISNDKTGKPQALLLVNPDQIPHLHFAFIGAAKQQGLKFASLRIDRRQIYGSKTENGQFIKTTSAQKEVLEKGGLLLLDLTGLSAANIAMLLQMTDPFKRKIGELFIAPETTIVALMPESMTASSDIGRRFCLIKEAPLISEPTGKDNDRIDESSNPPPEDAYTLDLYFDPSGWKSLLIGKLNASMQWEEGLLIRAIRENRPFVLLNMPNNPEIKACLRDLNAGEIYFSGERIEIPRGFKVYLRSHKEQDVPMRMAKGIASADYHLSPETLSQFLGQMTVDGSQVEPKPGVLSQTMTSKVIVQVTENLSEWQWRKFLAQRHQWQGKVTFVFAEGINPPSFVRPKEDESLSSLNPKFPNLIETNDLEYALCQLKGRFPDALFIPVTPNSRARHFMPEMRNRAAKGFDFTMDKGALFEMLESGKTVIFHGSIPQTLLNELAPLMNGAKRGIQTNGSFLPISGTVIVVHDLSAKTVLDLKGERISPTNEQLLTLLTTVHSTGEIKIARSLLEQNELPVTSTSIDCLIRYRQVGIQDPLSYFKANGERPAIYESRTQETVNALQVSPILYLYGPPASGKSHFIFEVLPSQMEATFFYGKNRIEAFLENEGDAILCLDEGDLNPEVIEELMGLQKRPATFFFRRKFYPLKGFKGVILTGNGQFAERKEMAFISHYGGALFFPEIPTTKIREHILAPLVPNDETGGAFISRTLELYLKAKKELDYTIELRQLRTIAAHFAFYYEHIPGWTGQQLADIAFADFCPETELIDSDSPAYKSLRNLILELKLESGRWNQAYILTQSRKALLYKIMMTLWLRQNGVSGLQKGLLIEGEAGEGKTDLVRKALFALTSEPVEEIDMSDEPGIVRRKLYEAFHAGRMIAVDEFDGLYEMEMNAYLTGFDLDGNKAKSEGFFVFATANGNSYPFRLPRSNALNSRFMEWIIPPYPPEELEEILGLLGVAKEEASQLVREHVKAVKKTRFEILKPTAADLITRGRNREKSKPRKVDDRSLSPNRNTPKSPLRSPGRSPSRKRATATPD